MVIIYQIKGGLIAALTPELATLRTKAEISQEDLTELIGASRQTYGALERGARKMSWTTFQSLVLFYDCNQKAHQMLRAMKAIPQEMMKKFNAGNETKEVNLGIFLGEGSIQLSRVLMNKPRGPYERRSWSNMPDALQHWAMWL